MVGTDGRQALLAGGLRLPPADDVLVPATPVFGAPELAGLAALKQTKREKRALSSVWSRLRSLNVGR